MSLQTTLARGEVRHWEREWAEHKQGCPKCSRRQERCGHGGSIWGQLAIARGNLKREREADKAPIPGQDGLFPVDEAKGEVACQP